DDGREGGERAQQNVPRVAAGPSGWHVKSGTRCEATEPRRAHKVLAGAFHVFRQQRSGGRMAYVESRNRATSDPATRKEVLAEIQSRGIEDVLLWFTDLEGHLKSFAITLSEVEGALDDGMGFDGSSITGFNAIEESDMVAIPDPKTFRVLPDGQ